MPWHFKLQHPSCHPSSHITTPSGPTEDRRLRGVNTALYFTSTMALQWQLSRIPFSLSHTLAWTATTTPSDNKAVSITPLFIGEHLFNSLPKSQAAKLCGSYNPYHIKTPSSKASMSIRLHLSVFFRECQVQKLALSGPEGCLRNQ